MTAGGGAQRLRPNSVVVDGVTVRYFTAGDDREHGDPVVLVHGIGGSTMVDFPFLMPMLARKRLVVSIDFAEPPTGRQGCLNLDRLEHQLASVVAQLGAGRRFTLLGYSLGAVVAAAFAAKVDTVARLVLAAGWLSPSTRLRLYSRIWRRLREEGSTAIGECALSCGYSSSFLSARTPDELASLAAAMPRASFVNRQLELAENLSVAELAPRIGATTLIVGCAEDGIATERQSKALFGVIPDARYAAVASGHALLAERPAELLWLAERFLENPRQHDAGTIIPPANP